MIWNGLRVYTLHLVHLHFNWYLAYLYCYKWVIMLSNESQNTQKYLKNGILPGLKLEGGTFGHTVVNKEILEHILKIYWNTTYDILWYRLACYDCTQSQPFKSKLKLHVSLILIIYSPVKKKCKRKYKNFINCWPHLI